MPDATPPSESPQNQSPEWLATFALPDGTLVRLRRVQADDEPLIAAAINSSSRETLLHRFFSPIRAIAPEQLRRMLEFDTSRETCIVGVLEKNSTRRIICGARYVKLARPHAAEIALTVHDEFQHCGLGSCLLRLLAQLALADQLEWFEAEVLSTNQKMLKLLRKLAGDEARGHWTGDVYHVELPIHILTRT
ncbi:MAG: GNAT family N-acetyltransferase [Verrucomicrobiota bacterium]